MSSQILVHTLLLFILSAEPLWAASSARSKESRISSEIEFNNRLSTPVAIYWVDYRGNEIFFGDLNPGATKVQQTFATHLWRVKDKKYGSLLKIVVVGPRREFVVIAFDDPLAKPTTPQIQRPPPAQPKPSLPSSPIAAGSTPMSTIGNFLTTVLSFIVGCGVIYAIILAVKTPSPDVKGNWGTLIENFQASPKEFYVSVERAIASRQVPEISKSRVEWKEGGLLTAYREYLRISREKLVLDICAAPYGTGFFVSWWLAELRPSAIGPTLIVIVSLLMLWNYLAFYYDFVAAAIYTLTGIILIVLLLGIFVNRSSGANWVRYVLVIPLIGKMIERFFMPPTYYRADTEAMFKASIEQSVQEVLKQMLQAKGLRALTELELKPIMRDFFQR